MWLLSAAQLYFGSLLNPAAVRRYRDGSPSPEKASWRRMLWGGERFPLWGFSFFSVQCIHISKAGSTDPQRWFWATPTIWPLTCGAWAVSWRSCTRATLCSLGRMKWSSWPASWRWGRAWLLLLGAQDSWLPLSEAGLHQTRCKVVACILFVLEMFPKSISEIMYPLLHF